MTFSYRRGHRDARHRKAKIQQKSPAGEYRYDPPAWYDRLLKTHAALADVKTLLLRVAI